MAMKKLIPVFLALLIVALTVPALAEIEPGTATVTVTKSYDVDYDLTKVVDITETTKVTDTYKVSADVKLDPDGRASASVVKNQINEGNTFEVTGCVTISDSIRDSFNDSYKGIGQINQSAGFMNNQANVVNAAITGKYDPLLTAEVVEVQWNKGLERNDPYASSFSDSIRDSFNCFTGVGQANQSAGFANNQNNVVNVAFGKNGALIATSDVILEQVNVSNNICLSGVSSTTTVGGSFNGFTGIAQANQSSGSYNNQANIVSFAGTK
jgi:hypothetical protein